MKRTLIAGAAFTSLLAATNAFAADLPVKAPAVVAVVYDWTGFYIGTNLGYSWGRGSTDGTMTTTSLAGRRRTAAHDVLPLSGRADVNGFIGGGQLGYNWQSGTWLFGLEGDIQFSNERASGDVCTLPGALWDPSVFTRDYKLDWFGTARGRVGYLPAERILLYVRAVWPMVASVAPHGPCRWISAPGLTPTSAGRLVRASRQRLAATGRSSLNISIWISATLVAVPRLTSCPGIQVQHTVFNTKFTDNIVRVGLNYKFGGPTRLSRSIDRDSRYRN